MTNDKERQAAFEQAGAVYPKVDAGDIDALMEQVEYDVHVIPDSTTTVVTAYMPMKLRNGASINFTLATEVMACVDPRNFNAELGAKYGIEKTEKAARNKLWELEGYLLACYM